MSEAELFWLAEQARDRQRIVEVGSFLGRSTRALADHTEGLVCAVDDWYGPRDAFIPDRTILLGTFRKNLQDKINAGKVLIVQGDHKTVAPWLGHGFKPDMVFIDGDHHYEAVKGDIIAWQQHLKSGGLLCGHDIDRNGVLQAVRELVPDAKTVTGTSIWFHQID